jgi:predicted Zn-dependent protease
MRALVPVVAALVAVAAPRPALAAPPWEGDLRREVEAQDEAIDQARRGKTMPALVQRYASRASRDPSPLAHFLLGRALFYSEPSDAGGARAQMTAALADDPSFWPAHVKLAVLAIAAKSWKDADEHLVAALSRAPHDGEARMLAARVAMQQSDWPAAAKHLSARIADAPDDLAARRLYAAVHFERKDYAAAVREMEVVRARQPDDPEVRAILARFLAKAGREDESIALLEASVAKDPHDVRALDGLLDAYAQKKDLPKYRSVL